MYLSLCSDSPKLSARGRVQDAPDRRSCADGRCCRLGPPEPGLDLCQRFRQRWLRPGQARHRLVRGRDDRHGGGLDALDLQKQGPRQDERDGQRGHGHDVGRRGRPASDRQVSVQHRQPRGGRCEVRTLLSSTSESSFHFADTIYHNYLGLLDGC